MGNSSNKKELNVAISKILIKTISVLPNNDSENLAILATKIYLELLHQLVITDAGREKKEVKTLQGAFKSLETLANLLIENQENTEFFKMENIRFIENVNILIKKMEFFSYVVLFNGIIIENLGTIISELKVQKEFYIF